MEKDAVYDGSTLTTLFDNIMNGVGKHPKSSKKKGKIEVHTVMKYNIGGTKVL